MKTKENIIRVKLDKDIEKDVYVLGINTQAAAHWLATQLNRYLDIQLKYKEAIPISQKETLGDNIQIYSTVIKKEEDNDNMDFFQFDNEKTKFWLIQSRGDNLYLYPRIKQMDYILVSDYPLYEVKDKLGYASEINYIFNLEEKDLGQKFKQLFNHIK